jgi:hypothetical protein
VQIIIRIAMYAVTLSLVLYLIISRYAGHRPEAGAAPAETTLEGPGGTSATAKSPDPTTGEYRIDVGKSLENSTIRREGPVPAAPDGSDNETRLIMGIDEVRDGPGLEPDPLYYLVDRVVRLGDNDVSIADAPTVSVSTLQREPDRWRGRPVALKASIRRLEVLSLPANPSGVTQLWDGWVASTYDGRVHLCRFLCPKRMPLRVGQTVMLRGLFMKIYRYATEKAGPQEAPLIIVNEPQVLADASGLPSVPGGGILVTLLVVLLVVYLLMMVYIQRRKKYMYERVEARRKSVLAKLRQEEAEESANVRDAGESGQPEEGEPDDAGPRWTV